MAQHAEAHGLRSKTRVVRVNHSHLKLGRTAPSLELKLRALPLKRYMTQPLPPAPPELHNADGAPIGMFGNDRYGDCTFAGMANIRAILSKLYGDGVAPPEDKVIAAYLAYTGGQDVGAVEQDVLNEAQRDGFDFGDTDGPWKLDAWAKVDLTDEDMCRSVIAVFGALYLGVSLPRAAQTQDVWDVGPNGATRGRLYGPGGWGGHALLRSGWRTQGNVDLVTWGMVKQTTPDWLDAYCDEGYVLLPRDLAVANGINHDALIADVQALRAV